MGEKISLAAKLAAVMAEVGRIPKRGTNEHFHYQFATDADVLDSVRDFLSASKVIIIPACHAVEHRQVATRNGEATITHAHLLIRIIDGESGEVIEVPWEGEAGDQGDKGLNKAYTAGIKYFLLKLFLIPTGDDPDQTDIQGPGGPTVPKAPASAGPRAPLPPAPKAAGAASSSDSSWLDPATGFKVPPCEGNRKEGKPACGGPTEVKVAHKTGLPYFRCRNPKCGGFGGPRYEHWLAARQREAGSAPPVPAPPASAPSASSSGLSEEELEKQLGLTDEDVPF